MFIDMVGRRLAHGRVIAVLAGSRQAANVWQNAPELKNTSTASMLYVFEQ